MLDPATERPLLYEETVPLLERTGLRSLRYQTHGFFGFCLFMNSDVLFVNRLFRFVPGIRAITRASTRSDGAILALPGLWRAGLQVVGIAQKRRRRHRLGGARRSQTALAPSTLLLWEKATRTMSGLALRLRHSAQARREKAEAPEKQLTWTSGLG